MSEIIGQLNFILALGGVALFLAAALLVFDLYSSRTLAFFIRVYGLVTGFFLTTAVSAVTLVYSEIFGFVPCGLCWLQRVFLYPQVFILGVALYTKDKTASMYGIALSVPGVIISLYQHYLQIGGTELVKCPTAGVGAECSERILFEFGFMTFPLLGAALFLFLIALYYYILRTN